MIFPFVLLSDVVGGERSSLIKPRIFPKMSKISKRANSDNFLSTLGYMYESSEHLSYTVYKGQQAKITLLSLPTSIFTFLYTTVVQ